MFQHSQTVTKIVIAIIIDMSKVPFVDSAGLASLVYNLKRVKSVSGEMKLASPSKRVVNALQLTSLDKVFKIYKTVRAAASAFVQ